MREHLTEKPRHTVNIGRPVHRAQMENVIGPRLTDNQTCLLRVDRDGDDSDFPLLACCLQQGSLVLLTNCKYSVERAHHLPLILLE